MRLWWSRIRTILVTGVVVVVVAAASGEGCGGGSSAATCPEVDNGAAAAGLTDRAQAAALARADLEEDLERARDIAQDVADATDGTCTWAKRQKGYKATVPRTTDEDDERIILVRVMARGGSRENYYRVVIPEQGAVDEDGEPKDDPEATHHDITDDAVEEILDLIDKIRERTD